jgi:tetratricopeptide (TPR) repeat protein
MKRILTGVSLFFILAMQVSIADMLSSAYPEVDKNNRELLNHAQNMVFEKPDSAMYLIEQALSTEVSDKDERFYGHAYYLLGNINLVKGQYPNALEYYEKSLKIRQALGDTVEISDLYSNIGIAYARMGDQETYLSYLQKALEIDRIIGDEHMIAADYNNIGNVYLNTNEPDEALYYYRKALEYSGSLSDSSLLYAIYGNMGNVYMQVEKYDSAMHYSQQAIQIAEYSRNKNELGTAYRNHALLYKKLEQYDLAISYYDSAIETLKEIGATRRLAKVLNDKARVMISINNASQAIVLTKQSLSIGTDFNDLIIRREALEILSLGFEMLGDYETALKYQKSFVLVSDSLKLSGKEADLQKLMRRFEVNEKKLEIKQLEMRNRFERRLSQLLALTILMVIVFLIVLFLKNRKLNRSYYLLLEKQKQIAGLKSPLNDSKLKQTGETTEQKQLIIKLEQLLEQQKAYLDPGISLDTLAEELNTNRSILSQLINLHYRKNFNMLINEYRINEVLRLFAKNHHNLYTLEAISMQVGFGSRASFNAAFKKVTGVTPTFYIKNL